MTRDTVTITWLDAHTTANEEISADDIEGIHAPLPTESTGYLVRTDAVGVTCASDIQTQDDGTLVYRGVSFVPRGMITSEKVTLGKKSRSKRQRKPKVKATVAPVVAAATQ